MDHFVVFLLTSHFFVLASGLEKHDDRIIISGGTIPIRFHLIFYSKICSCTGNFLPYANRSSLL